MPYSEDRLDMRLTAAQGEALLADLAAADLMTEEELLEREEQLSYRTEGESK